MKPIIILISGLISFSTLAKTPNWVSQPQKEVKNALAAVGCAASSNDFGIDSMEATMLAQSNLLAQIDSKIALLRKNVTSKTTDTQSNQAISNRKFETVATALSQGVLLGVETLRTDYVDINKQSQMCSLVAIQNSTVKEMLTQALSAENSDPLTIKNETMMFLEFLKKELDE